MELKRKFLKLAVVLTFALLGVVTAVYADAGVVTGNGVNFRSGPGMDYSIYSCLPRGTYVTVNGAEGNWYQVTYNGINGYMSRDYVNVRSTAVNRSGLAVDRDGYTGQTVVNYAAQFLGTPYVYGGSAPGGFDCSGLVYYVYKQLGYSLNRTAAGQASNGVYVPKDQLVAGDIVLFNCGGSGINHAGIYAGDGSFIHAVKPGVAVRYDPLYSGYYSSHYVTARRIIN